MGFDPYDLGNVGADSSEKGQGRKGIEGERAVRAGAGVFSAFPSRFLVTGQGFTWGKRKQFAYGP